MYRSYYVPNSMYYKCRIMFSLYNNVFRLVGFWYSRSKAITNPPYMHYKTSNFTDYSLLFSNLLIIDRPHWKYWINYYHLSSIINRRQLEWIGSLFIDNNPQRFEGIEVIPAISSQLRWSRNKTERTPRLYYVDDRRSGPDDEMIQREQHVRRDLDTTMTARSIVGELP